MTTTYTPPETDDGAAYYQDVEISDANLKSGALRERLDTRKYPKLGLVEETGLASFTLAVDDDGEVLTLTATATVASAPAAYGEVAFFDGAKFLGAAQLRVAGSTAKAWGTATTSTATLTGVKGAAAGNIVAHYEGNRTDQNSAPVAVSAPAITSANSHSFTHAVAGTFTVTTTGVPDAELILEGNLPPGVTFTDNGDGTATIAGTAPAAGSFPVTILAANGVEPDATQNFTLTVS